MADIGGEKTEREGRISGWLTPFANQLFEGSRMGEAGLAADLKAYHGTRRNEEIGDGWTRMEGVLAGGWRRIETKRCREEERERIGGRVGELGSSGMVLNLAQVSGSRGPSIFESSINSEGNSIPLGYIIYIYIAFLLLRSL